MTTGLVSVSFRPLTVAQVAEAARNAGLSCIEWGSDVHAPCDDPARLQEIVALQEQHGLTCCSYGTYFRLGADDVAQLPDYIRAAKTLGTDILRLWCGEKNPDEYTAEEKAALFSDCRAAADIAEKEGVTLCLECHNNTYTQTKEGSLELMQYVNSPAFRMYWQPNQLRTIDENIAYATLLAPYTTHIHVFQWKGREKFPLSDGIEEWRGYLKCFEGEHALLLEFMPDNDVATLPREADTLREIIGG